MELKCAWSQQKMNYWKISASVGFSCGFGSRASQQRRFSARWALVVICVRMLLKREEKGNCHSSSSCDPPVDVYGKKWVNEQRSWRSQLWPRRVEQTRFRKFIAFYWASPQWTAAARAAKTCCSRLRFAGPSLSFFFSQHSSLPRSALHLLGVFSVRLCSICILYEIYIFLARNVEILGSCLCNLFQRLISFHISFSSFGNRTWF